jgi:hypothetical protein
MFAFDRSAAAVLAPLALLVVVVLWSRLADAPAATQQAQVEEAQGAEPREDQTVAANLPSK